MIAVRVMETIPDEVVDVIAVRHALMAATLAVDVAGFVPCSRCGAAVRIAFRNLKAALVHVIPVHCMQTAVVQVIHVVSMPDGGVPAPLAVDMRMLRVNPVLRHGQTSADTGSAAKG